MQVHTGSEVPPGSEALPGPQVHPRPGERGEAVILRHPTRATALGTWEQPEALAIVTPDGPLPETLNRIALRNWSEAPQSAAEWELLAGRHRVAEDAFHPGTRLRRTAGTLIVEEDGRIWAIAPSNGFAGYRATFPKGRIEAGASAAATALKETHEETGLQVELLEVLLDIEREASVARYYLARRIGGTPAAMGWESQAVLLAPPDILGSLLNKPHDRALLQALTQRLEHPQSA